MTVPPEPSRRKGLAEETPCLRIAELKAAGLFDEGEATVTLNGEPIRIAHVGGADLIAEGGDLREPQPLKIAWVDMTYGRVPYFRRPDGEGRCSALYLVAGQLRSRQGAGLAYASQSLSRDDRQDLRLERILARLKGEDGRGPARGAPAERLRDALRAWSEVLPEEAYAILDREDEKRRASPTASASR